MNLILYLDGTESVERVQQISDGLVAAFGGKIRSEATVDPAFKEALVSYPVHSEQPVVVPLAPRAPLPPVAPTHAAAPASISVPEVVRVTSAELDANGLPWDERIHSSNRKRNGKGEWWAKRNVQPAELAAVQAELHALLASGSGTDASAASLFTGAELAEAEQLRQGPPVPPVAPVAPVVSQQNRYVEFVRQLTTLKIDFGRLSAKLLESGCSPGNLPSLKALSDKDPNALDRAAAAFGIALP